MEAPLCFREFGVTVSARLGTYPGWTLDAQARCAGTNHETARFIDATSAKAEGSHPVLACGDMW